MSHQRRAHAHAHAHTCNLRQLTDDMDVHNLWTRLRRQGRATTMNSVRKQHGSDADEQSLTVEGEERPVGRRSTRSSQRGIGSCRLVSVKVTRDYGRGHCNGLLQLSSTESKTRSYRRRTRYSHVGLGTKHFSIRSCI